MRVSISMSDPWDLGEALGWRQLVGTIERWSNGRAEKAALIRLDVPIEYRGAQLRYFVASARLEGASIESLVAGLPVFCSLTGVSDEQALDEAVFELRSWRGGLAIIGEVSVVNSSEDRA